MMTAAIPAMNPRNMLFSHDGGLLAKNSQCITCLCVEKCPRTKTGGRSGSSSVGRSGGARENQCDTHALSRNRVHLHLGFGILQPRFVLSALQFKSLDERKPLDLLLHVQRFDQIFELQRGL